MNMRDKLPRRFRAKISGSPSPDECWQWTGAPVANGYGRYFVQKDSRGVSIQPVAHRYAYETLIGPIPEGLVLDHLCRNRLCVNPAHLEPVTLAENVMRGEGPCAQHARKTHCIHGHEFTPENTYIHKKNGQRHCRECTRIRLRRRYALRGY